jgi:hypothetical protein
MAWKKKSNPRDAVPCKQRPSGNKVEAAAPRRAFRIPDRAPLRRPMALHVTAVPEHFKGGALRSPLGPAACVIPETADDSLSSNDTGRFSDESFHPSYSRCFQM